jgi:hypothetical protein
MFNLAARSAKLGRAIQGIVNGGMATAAPRIGETKVEMSPLEQSNFINYQRIEDNLTVVRSRFVVSALVGSRWYNQPIFQAEPASHFIREDFIRPS